MENNNTTDNNDECTCGRNLDKTSDEKINSIIDQMIGSDEDFFNAIDKASDELTTDKNEITNNKASDELTTDKNEITYDKQFINTPMDSERYKKIHAYAVAINFLMITGIVERPNYHE